MYVEALYRGYASLVFAPLLSEADTAALCERGCTEAEYRALVTVCAAFATWTTGLSRN